MQAVADVQDTPENWPNVPGSAAPGRSVQAVPFHDSARVVPDRVPSARPTAIQADAEVQDTLAKVFCGSAGESGVGWTRHAVPFHASARVRLLPRLLW